MTRFLATFATLLALLAPAAQAQISVKTTESSFDAAVVSGSKTTFLFDGLTAPEDTKYLGTLPITVGPATFAATDGWIYDGGAYSGFGGASYFETLTGGVGAETNVLSITFTTGVSAFGLRYGALNLDGAGQPLSLSVNGSPLVATALMPLVSGQTSFVGFVSSGALITSITITQPSTSGTFLNVTQFVTAIATPVPEPSLGLLFGVGLALVGTIARRKSA